ncbi:hypothetical protein AQ610_27745 [Burkholderia humptydooensis]|nr:hypothetical protein AQ610_27745 [Burkholderia humptydooensis]
MAARRVSLAGHVRANQCVVKGIGATVRRLPTASRASIAACIPDSLRLVSRYSRAGSDSATIPQPANSRQAPAETSAERSATTKSPLPCASIQPTGPAYQPRSKPSCARMRSSAAARGWPATAGVGCSAATIRSSVACPCSVAAFGVLAAGACYVPVDLAQPPARRALIEQAAGIWSNVQTADAVPPHWRSIPYGRPLPGQAYRVVDDAGRDAPDHVEGELLIGGASLARGYRNDPALTTERFVESDAGRWYRTGDRGRYWPDGTLEFLGRADRQVKCAVIGPSSVRSRPR